MYTLQNCTYNGELRLEICSEGSVLVASDPRTVHATLSTPDQSPELLQHVKKEDQIATLNAMIIAIVVPIGHLNTLQKL